MNSNEIGQPEANQGLSKEYAIQFPLAKNAHEGVAAEYEWINENLSGGEIVSQSFFDDGGKQYDVINVVLVDGKNIDIYFDITNFFGIF